MEEKCVIVLDETLPLGLLCNTAAILGVTLGRQVPSLVGRDVTDGNGTRHLGITELPIPILRAPTEALRTLRARLRQPEFQGLTAVDFSELAQSCRTYEEYCRRMAGTPEAELRYLGLGIQGGTRLVNRLTGSLPLLR